ncbi:unnamed protein product [Adineta steineri]|uniref:CCZ1/INTU/HSP4 first Longin domain-containing protein n=1 Tax=Adineta steineri TaxID=433720 RepID=A0A819J0B3_9BILA|nr:unnamed protein product [Adineta steineri]
MPPKTMPPVPFFFLFDFYLMQGSTDDNDVLPEAIIYFYPTDPQLKDLKILDCGEIVGVVQYFQHDLFRSIPKTLYFQKTFVVHDYHGRHSGFLCAPHDYYTEEEAVIHLKYIMDLFNMLYGTWNHVNSTYGQDRKINEFLNRALTPIVHYVLNHRRSIPYLFSVIEYAPLKKGNQRVLLECKHCLNYLRSAYGIKDGLIGYDKKILYSSYDFDTTFYLQLLFQITKDLPEDLICIPWDSEFKLKNGVSLFRIYTRRKSSSTSTHNVIDTSPTTNTTTPTANITTTKMTTSPINIFNSLSFMSDDSSSLRSQFSNNSELSPSLTDRRRIGVLGLAYQSCSSEETGFDTDTMDDSSSASAAEERSSVLSSITSNSDKITAEKQSYEESLTDEQKLENLRSRASTLSNDMEKTIEIEFLNSPDDLIDRIHLTEIDAFESSDDDDIENFKVIHRTTTVTSAPEVIKLPEIFKSDRQEVKVSWSNIPDKNNENERDELVLYVQRNSRMVFAGVMEQSSLSDEYLKTLWNLMLSQMANMETEVQVISTTNEMIKLSTDVKYQFNENTHSADFERVYDGPRVYRKFPAEDSSFMGLYARTELNRHPDRKVIGLSRGSHLISADRRLPDRTIYLSRRFQESL